MLEWRRERERERERAREGMLFKTVLYSHSEVEVNVVPYVSPAFPGKVVSYPFSNSFQL